MNSFEQRQDERNAMMFERMAESFINQWAPRDHRDRAEFSAQLFSILRQLAVDVQAPLAKQFAEVVGRMHMAPMLMPKESDK